MGSCWASTWTTQGTCLWSPLTSAIGAPGLATPSMIAQRCDIPLLPTAFTAEACIHLLSGSNNEPDEDCIALQGPIHQSIEWLDRQGMDIIEQV